MSQINEKCEKGQTENEGMDTETISLPQKRYYRQRAHSNPIADHCIDYPLSPDHMDWSKLYPRYSKKDEVVVRHADIGCGYGGLLLTLSEMYPDTLSLGMEIRVKVSDYVMDRIKALRSQHTDKYENIACVRTNAMKYLINYFHKEQLRKIFFLYPDPHFKKAKHKWRIVSKQLLDIYAYVLAIGGLVYTVTDVQEVHEWIVKHFVEHPLFSRVENTELNDDPVVEKLFDSTEEGQKVTRNNGEKFLAVFRKISDPYEKLNDGER